MNSLFPSQSTVSRYLLNDGHIRLVSIDGTDLCKVLGRLHELDHKSLQGYSEALLGALFISSTVKENETINFNAVGSGFHKQSIIDVQPGGHARGLYIQQTDPDLLTFGVDGKAGPWGTGILSVLYTQREDGQTPYTGRVAISDGHLNTAINEYFSQSIQLPTRVALSVNPIQNEFWARGLMLQVMGEASKEERDWVHSLKSGVLEHLASINDNQEVFEKELRREWKNFDFKLLEKGALTGFCNCDQERIERALLLIGKAEAEYSRNDEGLIELTCDFCRTQYVVTQDRLGEIFAEKPVH